MQNKKIITKLENLEKRLIRLDLSQACVVNKKYSDRLNESILKVFSSIKQSYLHELSKLEMGKMPELNIYENILSVSSLLTKFDKKELRELFKNKNLAGIIDLIKNN